MKVVVPRPKVSAPTERAILRRIRRARGDSAFKPVDFLDLASRAAVDQALSRLVAKGVLRRVGRGLYDLPRIHPLLGPLLPTPESVRKALERQKVRFQPTGAYAANLLGLTEQVPTQVVFLTDGGTRKIRVGDLEIGLRHTAPRFMATAGRLSGLVIQALRHLGKDQVGPEVVATLRNRLSPKDRACLRRDLKFAPVWIARILRDLGED